MGLIYKEQFNQNKIAAYKFEDLLQFEPAEKYVLPSKYYLYKIYSESNDLRAQKYKDDIVANYPDSKYTQLILNPNEALSSEGDDSSPENVYKQTYYAYQDGNYQEVITQSELAISKYSNETILPKFELLKAYAIGKKRWR